MNNLPLSMPFNLPIVDLHSHVIADDAARYPLAPMGGKQSDWSKDRPVNDADMLAAMNTGHEGSLTTLHANSPRDALARLETMILMAGMDLPLTAVRSPPASRLLAPTRRRAAQAAVDGQHAASPRPPAPDLGCPPARRPDPRRQPGRPGADRDHRPAQPGRTHPRWRTRRPDRALPRHPARRNPVAGRCGTRGRGIRRSRG